MLEIIILIIFCHLVGDYVLQCDFIAQTKGKTAGVSLLPTVEKFLSFILYFSFNELENSFFILVNTIEDILSVQSAILTTYHFNTPTLQILLLPLLLHFV